MTEIVVLNNIFIENAICLSQRMNIPIAKKIDKKIVYIVYGGHSNPILLNTLQERLGCKYIILNSEHYSSSHFSNKYYLQLLKNNYICDYLPANRQFLKTHYNINILSYYWFEFMHHTSNDERPIDILFIGAKSNLRVEVETKLKKAYPNKSIQFYYPDVYSDVTNLLLQAQTVLNIPFYENNMETHRINKALACGCTVVSYVIDDPQLRELYNDYVYFSKDYISVVNTSSKHYGNLVKNQNENIYKYFAWSVSQVVKRFTYEVDT